MRVACECAKWQFTPMPHPYINSLEPKFAFQRNGYAMFTAHLCACFAFVDEIYNACRCRRQWASLTSCSDIQFYTLHLFFLSFPHPLFSPLSLSCFLLLSLYSRSTLSLKPHFLHSSPISLTTTPVFLLIPTLLPGSVSPHIRTRIHYPS